jgi:hypothetical protein
MVLTVSQQLTKVKKLIEQRNNLVFRLECSLALKEIYPDVEYPATSYLSGSSCKGFIFNIKDKNGVHSFKIDEIKIPDCIKEYHKNDFEYISKNK